MIGGIYLFLCFVIFPKCYEAFFYHPLAIRKNVVHRKSYGKLNLIDIKQIDKPLQSNYPSRNDSVIEKTALFVLTCLLSQLSTNRYDAFKMIGFDDIYFSIITLFLKRYTYINICLYIDSRI